VPAGRARAPVAVMTTSASYRIPALADAIEAIAADGSAPPPADTAQQVTAFRIDEEDSTQH